MSGSSDALWCARHQWHAWVLVWANCLEQHAKQPLSFHVQPSLAVDTSNSSIWFVAAGPSRLPLCPAPARASVVACLPSTGHKQDFSHSVSAQHRRSRIAQHRPFHQRANQDAVAKQALLCLWFRRPARNAPTSPTTSRLSDAPANHGQHQRTDVGDYRHMFATSSDICVTGTTVSLR
jgi:hypothetical protein